jgi:hypothetical protein
LPLRAGFDGFQLQLHDHSKPGFAGETLGHGSLNAYHHLLLEDIDQ